MKLNKGDRVLVRAVVYSKWPRDGGYRYWDNQGEDYCVPETPLTRFGELRPLIRVPSKETWEGVVVGCSVRKTGVYVKGYGWDNPGELREEKNHPVVMVISVETQKWINPYACLEKDLELLQE